MNEVLLLAKAYPPITGGVETYSEAIVRSYIAHGYNVTVLTQTHGSLGWFKREYPEGIVEVFNTGAGPQYKVLVRLVFELRKLLKSRSFDFCHATTWRPSIAALPWRKVLPTVITVHGREVMNYPFFLKYLMKKCLGDAVAVVAVSDATLEIAKNALGKTSTNGKWVSSFNGITYPAEARSFQKDYLKHTPIVKLLSLARHVPRKNLQGCLRSLARLKSEGLQFEYTIGGRGPMHEELRSLSAELNLSAVVNFIGYVEDGDIPELYKAHDVFLHPQTNVGEGNDFEGFGLVIADAMSFGCTVLAGDAGGPRDFVKHNINGILVDGLNDSELDIQIRRLINEPELRNRLSMNGREFAISELSWFNHVDCVLNAKGR